MTASYIPKQRYDLPPYERWAWGAQCPRFCSDRSKTPPADRLVVADDTITSIDILNHRTGKAKPAEAITQDVINAQSLEVDAISSTTIGSKTIDKY